MLGRKVIRVRCINCSYNNVAKGIRLLDKKQVLFIQETFYSSFQELPLTGICVHAVSIIITIRLHQLERIDITIITDSNKKI